MILITIPNVGDKTQSPNLVNIALTLAVLVLGYRIVSSYTGSPRPAPLETGSASQDSNKVELRLWQDPFEPFESTNESRLVKDGGDNSSGPWLSIRGQALNTSYSINLGSPTPNSPSNTYSLSKDIEEHTKGEKTNDALAIIAVMLEGSSYAEDKEVRLRLRYAVELALLTGEFGPEDRTHVHTNSISLKGDADTPGRTGDFSYEWFGSRSDMGNPRALVLWLKEDDFSDKPASRLNSLIAQIPVLTNSSRNICFFLIGPRSSDTLRALTLTNDTNVANLVAATKARHFKILSPEATAIVHPEDYHLSWEFATNEIKDLPQAADSLVHHASPLLGILWSNLPSPGRMALSNYLDRQQEVLWEKEVWQTASNSLSDMSRVPIGDRKRGETEMLGRLSSELKSNDLTNLVHTLGKLAEQAESGSWKTLTSSDRTALFHCVLSDPGRAAEFVVWALNNTINGPDLRTLSGSNAPPEIEDLSALATSKLDRLHFNCWVLENACSNILSANRASDPYGLKLEHEFNARFGDDVFHNWIATDQRLAELIAEELANRLIVGPLEHSSNVVVILSEQDTYFGSKLADEWIDALVGNGVCPDSGNVWQFAYLRGLDGSKPAGDNPAPKSASLADSADQALHPEQALQSLEQQQQQHGLKADGNAQIDYIDRLADMLHEKDKEMKNRGTGRIVAVGLTGSDAYDKLILLREVSRQLPEAVFFTTDLEAPLGTANVLPYSRNLLVASAYPVNPDSANNNWPSLEEFPPFRDVYQAAVFHACNVVVTNLWETNLATANYDAAPSLLTGSLWKIGRHHPVFLSPSQASLPREPANAFRRLLEASFFLKIASRISNGSLWYVMPTIGLIAAGLMLGRVKASCRSGIKWPERWSRKHVLAQFRSVLIKIRKVLNLRPPELAPIKSGAPVLHQEPQPASNQSAEVAKALVSLPADTTAITKGIEAPAGQAAPVLSTARSPVSEMDLIEDAHETARQQQISLGKVLGWIFVPLLAGLLLGAFWYVAWSIAQRPGEEPWDFSSGTTIWLSECLRFGIIIGSLLFFCLLRYRLHCHRKKLWKRYFVTPEQCHEKAWKEFWENENAEWNTMKPRLIPGNILQNSLIAFWSPPFHQEAKRSVDMAALFACYLRFGRFWLRIRRILISVALYFVVAAALVFSLHDLPTWLLVRGYWSHLFDRYLICVAVVMVLGLLFYMLDGALLTKRILGCIGLYPTRWPDPVLRQKVAEFSVKEEHLDGFLDVEFAAIQTQEIGYWMFGPFVFIFLLAVSRSAFLDSWTWPTGLILIYLMNFVLGVGCWAVVRSSAGKVRQFALDQIELAKSSVRSEGKTIKVVTPDGDLEVAKEQYLKNLESLRKSILKEHRGAYSKVFQDPSYLGMCIPSGVSGLTYLLTWWLNR